MRLMLLALILASGMVTFSLTSVQAHHAPFSCNEGPDEDPACDLPPP
jgi:hypothetical protein